MDIVVTLICNSARPLLDNEFASRLSCFLDHIEMGATSREVLSDGVANDFRCSASVGPRELRQEIKAFLRDAPVDIVVQPAEGRRKKLLVADMDSTIIAQECIDELADFAGKRAEISAITERAMRGELDFDAALKERVAMLKGLPDSVLEETFRKRITLNPGAAAVMQAMRRNGATTALVSGGFTFFTRRVADLAGFDTNEANELVVKNGVLTGDVAPPIKGRAAKEAALLRLAKERAIPLEETMAVGDGANDLSMLAKAGLGVAYRAKPAVAEAAAARIDHGDLTALLYIQGYRASEFAR